MTTRTLSVFSSFWDWLHDLWSGTTERGSERQRLAQLAAHRQSLQKHAEESGAKAIKRPALTDQDRDNYLRGELISVAHDTAEKHNRETVSQWLHPEEGAMKEPVAPTVECQPAWKRRASSDLEYQVTEKRILEFTNIGMGMDEAACLSSFISRQNKDAASEGPPRSTRELMTSRKTVKDMPALQAKPAKEFNFRPLDEAKTKTG